MKIVIMYLLGTDEGKVTSRNRDFALFSYCLLIKKACDYEYIHINI